jgi:hypothetical protein
MRRRLPRTQGSPSVHDPADLSSRARVDFNAFLMSRHVHSIWRPTISRTIFMDRNSCCLASGILVFVFCLSCASVGWALSLGAATTTTLAISLIWRAHETMRRNGQLDLCDRARLTPPLVSKSTARRAKSPKPCEVEPIRSSPRRPCPSKALGPLVHEKREPKTPRIGGCRMS